MLNGLLLHSRLIIDYSQHTFSLHPIIDSCLLDSTNSKLLPLTIFVSNSCCQNSSHLISAITNLMLYQYQEM